MLFFVRFRMLFGMGNVKIIPQVCPSCEGVFFFLVIFDLNFFIDASTRKSGRGDAP